MPSFLRSLFLASLVGAAVPATALEPTILVSLKRFEYDSFFNDCRISLQVLNRSGLPVHEFRLFYLVKLVDGTVVESCEHRSGHQQVAFQERCSPAEDLQCETVGQMVVGRVECLDKDLAALDCTQVLGSADERIVVELAE